MNRLFFCALGAMVLIACSRGSDTYVIRGRVVSTDQVDLNGKRIFLVPIECPVTEEVDSTVIENDKFEFRGNRPERMCDIRLDMHYRMGIQNLLVVNEPGEINVVIGPESSGGGTPQNDSLQVWKDLTIGYRMEISGTKDGEGRKALRERYRARTIQMGKGLGGESTLGKFLLNMFPEASVADGATGATEVSETVR